MLGIAVPTLFLHAEDDPMAPVESLGTAIRAATRPGGNANLTVCVTRTGGHVGWWGGWLGVPQRWQFSQVMTFGFLAAAVAPPAAPASAPFAAVATATTAPATAAADVGAEWAM